MVVDNAATPTKLFTASVKTTSAPSGSTDWLTENSSDSLPMSYAGENDRYPLVRQQLLYRAKIADMEPQLEIKDSFGTVINAKTDVLPGEQPYRPG